MTHPMRLTRRTALTMPPLAALAAGLETGPLASHAAAAVDERWPGIPYDPSYAGLVAGGVADYPPGDHLRFLIDYDPLGPYFNAADVVWNDAANSTYRFDSDGVPQTLYNGTYYNHPVTFCHYALHLHDRITRKGETGLDALFLRVVDRLLATQDGTGAFRYPFPYRVYNFQFAAGWPSAMAQGVALSTLRRAYDLHPDRRYISAGNAAIVPLTRMVAAGGVQTSLAALDPSLSGHLWLEEFPTVPGNFKLNGFLFTLFGCYDWWQRAPLVTTGSKTVIARDLFAAGTATAALALPYFDLHGYTTPDMRYAFTPGVVPRIQPGYHRVHIYQLHALKQITQGDVSERFGFYERLWRFYVGDVSA